MTIQSSHKIDKAYIKDQQLLAEIIYLQDKYRYKLGYRRLKMHLDSAYISYGMPVVNHKRIIRVCKKYGIRCKVRVKNPYKNIAKATKEHNYFQNLIDRDFNIAAPRTKIITDITYLHFKGDTAYLSTAKDSVTGEIVAHNIRQDMSI